MTTISLTSFAETARTARDLGWTSVLPLPHGRKKSPPIGYTGADGKLPTDADYAAWNAQAGEYFNIAVVLPENVMGLDVDVRDGKRGDAVMAETADRLGDLPPTYSITSRGADSVSRIYLYRRSHTDRLRGFLGGPVDGVEIIQHAHRYIVGPGSLHPDGGTYTVYGPDGEAIEGLPAVDDLALLPEAWEDDLTSDLRVRASSTDVEEFLVGLPDGEYDDDTARLLDEFDHRLNRDYGWGRFEDCHSGQAAMLRVTMDLALAGACGSPGVPMALAAAQDIFIAYRLGRGDNRRDANGTWRRGLTGAVSYVRDLGIRPLPPFEVPADILAAGAQDEAKVGRKPRNRFADRLLTRRQLAYLPSPEPLIGDTLDRRTVALLAGYHGTGKSFVALGWAAAVATGTPWMGRSVQRGRVLYIVGEGAHGINDRLAAWEHAHGVRIDDDALVTYPRAVQIASSAELTEMLDHLHEVCYDLVVIDTVARSAVGLDENSAKDMGVFIDAAEQIKRATSSGAVLLVHHTGKDKTTIRGSSALEAAMDTVYTTEGDPLNLRLKRTKRKDGPMEDTLQLRLVPTGESAVLEPMDAAIHRKANDNDLESRAWVALGYVFGDRIFTKTEAVTVLTDEEQASLSRASAYRAVTRLGLAGVLRDVTEGARSPQFTLDRQAAKKIGLPAAQPFRPLAGGDTFLPAEGLETG